MATAIGWSLLWVVWLATDTQLEAMVRKVGGELKLEKDLGMSTLC